MPLPSFLEVQWSSLRVGDPLLNCKQQNSPKDQFNDDLLKAETPPKTLALLSPTTLDQPPLQADLLMEPSHAASSSRILFADEPGASHEISNDLWPM